MKVVKGKFGIKSEFLKDGKIFETILMHKNLIYLKLDFPEKISFLSEGFALDEIKNFALI